MEGAGSTDKVLWAELLPYEFKARLRESSVVYMPLGLCEPHGQISAFGLDTFKAEYLCTRTARQAGGIVAPTMGYHVHEVGPSAKFLEDNVGENNPHLSSVPSFVFYHFYLYQLRAFYNAGFHSAVVLSGHGGAHLHDLRKISRLFAKRTGMNVWYGTDFDLVEGLYAGDHAGKYEISMLMHIRPDLIDPERKKLANVPDAGGRLALGDSADQATREYGALVSSACEAALIGIASELGNRPDSRVFAAPLGYDVVEELWAKIVRSAEDGTEVWATMQPREGQAPVSEHSRWKPYERVRMRYT